MIWGLTLEPGCIYTQIVTAQTHLSLATLDCRGKVFAGTDPVKVSHVVLKTNSCEQLVCSLVQGLVLQQQLDLKITPNEEVSFSNQGNCCVYITGYSIDPDFSDYKYVETNSLCASETDRVNEAQTPAYDGQPGWETEDSQVEEEEEKRSPNNGVRDANDGPLRSEVEESREYSSNRPAPLPSQTSAQVFEEIDVSSQAEDVVCIAVKDEPEDVDGQVEDVSVVPTSHKDCEGESYPGVSSCGPHKTELKPPNSDAVLHDFHQNASRSHETPSTREESGKMLQQKVLILKENVQVDDINKDRRVDDIGTHSEVLIGGEPDLRRDEGSMPVLQQDVRHEKVESRTSETECLQHHTNNLLSVPSIQCVPTPVMPHVNKKRRWTTPSMVVRSPQDLASLIRTNKNKAHQRPLSGVVQRQSPSHTTHACPSKSSSGDGPLQYTTSHDSMNHSQSNQDLVKPKIHEFKKQFAGTLHRFQCKYCGKSLNCRRSLIHHEMIHTGDKPFTCRFCQKSFIQKSQWKVHERIHTGVKPFVCRICGKAFSRLYNKRMHAKTCEEFCSSDIGKHPD